MKKQEESETHSSNYTISPLVFTKSCLIKNKKNVLSPRIFMI